MQMIPQRFVTVYQMMSMVITLINSRCHVHIIFVQHFVFVDAIAYSPSLQYYLDFTYYN